MKGNTIQKQKNIKRVLKEIRIRGPVSKRELQAITGFSWGNISTITALLSAENFIMASGKQETFVGRKPEEFDININDNYIIGIDFNYKGILLTLCDLKGRVIEKLFTEFKENNKEYALNELFIIVEKVLKENCSKNISYIALAMQGEVDTENGISVCNSAIKDWVNVPVCEELKKRFGIDTVMFHDPDCLLYSETIYGGLENRENENSVLLRIDHGVGIAAILNGKMYMGSRGKTCEIGTTVVPASGGWAMLQDVIGEEAVSRRHFSNEACEKIALNARLGDREALGIFSDIGRSLGFAINNAVSLLNPETVVLFGNFTNYCDLYLHETERVLNDLIGDNAPKILISKQNLQAAAVGAALFAADKVIEKLEFDE